MLRGQKSRWVNEVNFGIFIGLVSLVGVAASTVKADDLNENLRPLLQAATVFIRMRCTETLEGGLDFDPALEQPETRMGYASGVFVTADGLVLTAYHTYADMIRKDERQNDDGVEFRATCPPHTIEIDLFKPLNIERARDSGEGDYEDVWSARWLREKDLDVLFLRVSLGDARHPSPLCARRRLQLDDHKDLPIVGAGFPIENSSPRFHIASGTAGNEYGQGEGAKFLEFNLPSIKGQSGGPVVDGDGGLIGIYQGRYKSENPAFNRYHFSAALHFFQTLEDLGATCATGPSGTSAQRKIDDLLANASSKILAGEYVEAQRLLSDASTAIAASRSGYGESILNVIWGHLEYQKGAVKSASRRYDLALNVKTNTRDRRIGRALAELGHGDILLAQGLVDEAKEQFLKANEVLTELGFWVTGAGRLARLRFLTGEYTPNSEALILPRTIPKHAWGPPETAQLALVRAGYLAQAGDFPAATKLLDGLIAKVSEKTFPAFLVRVRLVRARVFRSQNALSAARREVSVARHIARQIEDEAGLGLSNLAEAKIDLDDGRFTDAARRLNDAITRLKEQGELWSLSDARERLAGLKIRSGKYDEAAVLLENLVDFFDRVNDERQSAQSRFRLALQKFPLGRIDEAETLLKEARDRFDGVKLKDLPSTMRANWALGELAVHRGDLAAATEYLMLAEQAKVKKHARIEAHFEQLRGGIAFLQSNEREGRRALRESIKLFKNLNAGLKTAETQLMYAILSHKFDRSAEVRRQLDLAFDGFDQANNVFGVARIHFARACLLYGSNNSKLAELYSAMALFSRTKLYAWSDQTQDAIDAVLAGEDLDCNIPIITNIT